MASHSVSHVKAHLAEFIETTRATGEAIIITRNGEGAAVLQDLATYDEMRRSLSMLKLIAHGVKDLERGHSTAQDDVFRSIRKRLARK